MSRTVRHRQRGQVISITAAIMVAMVGALAIVIDVGMFTVVQRQFQAAADAGALAGAWYQPVCLLTSVGCDHSRPAIEVAEEVAHANADSMARLCGGATPDVTATVGTTLNLPARVNAIVVTVECDAGYSFGRILGLQTATVRGTSAAAIGLRTATKDIGDFPTGTGACVYPYPIPAPPAPQTPCLVARLIE